MYDTYEKTFARFTKNKFSVDLKEKYIFLKFFEKIKKL